MASVKDQSLTQVQDATQEILLRHESAQNELLPILHDIQDSLGYIPPEVVSRIAQALNISRAEVHGVVTYYHHFRTAPAGRHVVQICRAEACQSRGGNALLAHAESHLGCKVNETTPDGQFTLQAVYCLGLCACSPSLSIDEVVHARMTPSRFDDLITQLKDKT